MTSLLRNVAALIIAVTILQLASGLLGVRIPLAFTEEGHSRTALGLIAASYSAGFMMGAMIATQLLARVGHIRVYAACAAIFSVTTLALHFSDQIWAWGLSRMIAGMAVALMFAAIESWLNFSISTRVRGEVMSVYMVLTKGALAFGPFFAFGYAPAEAEPWMIAAAIAALSMVPICFTAAEQPAPPKAQPLALVEQFAIAPAAVIGSFGAGLVNGGVLALAPLYAAEHYGSNAAAEFYAAAFIGSLLLQWPAGRLSDRVDRRLVIAGLAALAAIAAFALAIWSGRLQSWSAVLLFFAWGAGALSFYGIAVSHMADRAEPGKLAQSAAGLLFVWAGGSVIGPLILGPLVDRFDVAGMFWFAGAAAVAVAAAMFWRRTTREAAPMREEFAPQLGTSVAAGEIVYGDESPGEDSSRIDEAQSRA
ncbi:MAG TPA: MFS transporter [Vitreimonas sp.]|uniref:MFS transporter n=1 Tax=Vitreimonas sp. TaxID=3069702 RepID=UPI002D5C486A|nr:MFS transporter [Vitreimonas sp.]HYD89656.1 MFS transporter [Vitreimonas sp.]